MQVQQDVPLLLPVSHLLQLDAPWLVAEHTVTLKSDAAMPPTRQNCDTAEGHFAEILEKVVLSTTGIFLSLFPHAGLKSHLWGVPPPFAHSLLASSLQISLFISIRPVHQIVVLPCNGASRLGAAQLLCNRKEISGWTKGRLNCPQCQARVGGFDFVSGARCPCSGALPSVHVIRSKADLKSSQ
ncbi:hypothetical protein B566_EDAN002090 [Ephemera danica]|nr:hypothetical protein B566_EDAN002090 [Ephemera danica]